MPKGIPRDKSFNHTLIHRLQIAHGQLQTVIDMAKRGDYCIDVINQSQAVQAALRQADNVLMEHHLHTCVAAEIKKGNAKEVITEVMEIIKKK
jgi:DNA-binding FrmR family transcriptional regulator